MEEKCFGSLKPLPRSEYNQIYELTGLDVDGRQCCIEKLIQMSDYVVEHYIDWARQIPGFIELSTVDQELLIKGYIYIH